MSKEEIENYCLMLLDQMAQGEDMHHDHFVTTIKLLKVVLFRYRLTIEIQLTTRDYRRGIEFRQAYPMKLPITWTTAEEPNKHQILKHEIIKCLQINQRSI